MAIGNGRTRKRKKPVVVEKPVKKPAKKPAKKTVKKAAKK
jgi:hypothetical protein